VATISDCSAFVLQLVEEAGLRITAGSLPAGDHGAGGVVELAGGLDVEADPGQPALHVAALRPVEAELVFGDLIRFLGEGGGIDAGGQVAGGGRGTILQRGDAGQRDRLEGAARIVGQIGVEFFRPVGVLDRTPELELDFRDRTADGSGRIRRFGRSPRRVEIDRADQVGMAPGQLALVGLFVDLGADPGHGLLYLDAGGQRYWPQARG